MLGEPVFNFQAPENRKHRRGFSRSPAAGKKFSGTVTESAKAAL
jgi:hypothetical protein